MRAFAGSILAVVGLAVLAAPALAGEFITLVSTTSTEASGLFDAIHPDFTARTGIEVRVVAVGTGQALRIGRKGDADVVFVHDTASEEAFVRDGAGVRRDDVMYNDFVIVGPSQDPAGIRGGRDAPAALAKIAAARAAFVSRGDDSGTHKAELRLWVAAGVDPRPSSGGWYAETGTGQGRSLNTASGMNAYMLSDRGTWLSFLNRGELEVLVEGDPRLFNPYGVILVNPERHPHVKARAAQAYIDWLLSQEGQAAIGAFRVAGQPLFLPNAQPPSPRPEARK